MAVRNYAYKIAKRTNEKKQWNNYRKLKNMTNRKLKSAESLYYKNLIESAVNPREMWKSLNSVLGHNKGRPCRYSIINISKTFNHTPGNFSHVLTELFFVVLLE